MREIKEQREKLKLSICKAAEKATISAPYWLDIERRRKKPSDEVLLKISEVSRRTK